MTDTIVGIALPYLTSAFGIFLLRQTFKTVPKSLDEAAQMEGANAWEVLWTVYVPLAKPIYLAYGLVSISFHWNNFLWPLIVTNSPEVRPLTVGLSIFATVESGIEWSLVNAATLMTTAPLILIFLIFQKQFISNFMRAGIK
jgi:sn-glycerol 3-phosphate transport system permease protein